MNRLRCQAETREIQKNKRGGISIDLRFLLSFFFRPSAVVHCDDWRDPGGEQWTSLGHEKTCYVVLTVRRTQQFSRFLFNNSRCFPLGFQEGPGGVYFGSLKVINCGFRGKFLVLSRGL
jgi:hypothetical protein